MICLSPKVDGGSCHGTKKILVGEDVVIYACDTCDFRETTPWPFDRNLGFSTKNRPYLQRIGSFIFDKKFSFFEVMVLIIVAVLVYRWA